MKKLIKTPKQILHEMMIKTNKYGIEVNWEDNLNQAVEELKKYFLSLLPLKPVLCNSHTEKCRKCVDKMRGKIK